MEESEEELRIGADGAAQLAQEVSGHAQRRHADAERYFKLRIRYLPRRGEDRQQLGSNDTTRVITNLQST